MGQRYETYYIVSFVSLSTASRNFFHGKPKIVSCVSFLHKIWAVSAARPIDKARRILYNNIDIVFLSDHMTSTKEGVQSMPDCNASDFRALAEESAAYLIERRRDYHAHPELPGNEIRTCASIRRDLEALGIEVEPVSTCHGLIGTIRGARPGPTVALRADIDALAFQEQTGYEFASQNRGVMHACGHDAHIAMLLASARILSGLRETLPGTVRLIVQPEEETVFGSRKMIAAGALDGVSAIYGAHVWNALESPLLDVSPGPRMAACDMFTIRVHGVSAHGAAPHEGIDAIVAACAMVEELQIVVSRENNPADPLVVTVGSIHGGKAFNVIANEVVMEGTVRYFSAEKRPEDMIRAIVQGVAAAHRATADFDYFYGNRPVVNDDAALCDIAKRAVLEMYGGEGLGHMPATMSSEDFAAYTQKVPALFAFVGSHNAARGLVHPNHHEQYSADEAALPRGAALMSRFAWDYLHTRPDCPMPRS